MEDAIGFFGVLFVVILPPIALAVSLLTLLALYLVKRHIEVSEEKQKTPCPQCETLIYPCGTTCYSCGYSLTEIRKVGLFGVIRNDVLVPISDELAHNRVHRFPMLSWKRCYSCGERLTGRTIDQHCMVCESKPFSSMAEVDEFLRFLNPRLWRAMLICGVLGFIPLFGLIPGLIYYRLTLISCLRGYIPRSSNFLLRWGVRLLNILLLAFQPVPILGACMLPIMCSTNYFVYREAIRRQSRKAFA